MKRLTLLAMITILGTDLAAFTVGAKGGVTLSQTVDDPDHLAGTSGFSREDRLGFAGYGFAVMPLSQIVSFHAEVGYTMRGQIVRTKGIDLTTGSDVTTDIIDQLDYADSALLLRFSFGIPYVMFGGYFGYKIKATRQVKVSGASAAVEEALKESLADNKEIVDVKDTDFGLSMGLGFTYAGVLIEGRGSMSADTIRTDEIIRANTPVTKNIFATFTAGYGIDL